MRYFLIISDKATGEEIDKPEIEAREHITNFQAMIYWKGVSKICYGATMDEAAQEAYTQFASHPLMKDYSFVLMRSPG